jgi:glycosyltransferase involved in cell wall biosynthesis
MCETNRERAVSELSPRTPRPGLFLMANTLERGGTERQFVTLATALAPGAFDVGLGCLARRGEFLDKLPEILEFSPGGSLYRGRSLHSRIALARHLRRRRVVVAHAFDFYANLMLIPAARLARIPVVIGSHRQLGDLQTWKQFHVQKIAFSFCDRVVCNSQAAADRLRRAGVRQSKLVVIPNALSEEAFAEATPVLPVSSGVTRIGMIARMNDPAKNHRTFLRVAACLAAKFEHLEFVLVGDGPLRAELEAFAAQVGLGSRVRFLGDRQDIPAVLGSLDITMLPSSSESLSNVILESMAAGVPVIATDVGGNPELLQEGKTGLLVPLDDNSFVQAAEQLLLNPEQRKAYGQRARMAASSRYRLSAISNSYEQLYKTLLAEKTSSPELREVWGA